MAMKIGLMGRFHEDEIVFIKNKYQKAEFFKLEEADEQLALVMAVEKVGVDVLIVGQLNTPAFQFHSKRLFSKNIIVYDREGQWRTYQVFYNGLIEFIATLNAKLPESSKAFKVIPNLEELPDVIEPAPIQDKRRAGTEVEADQQQEMIKKFSSQYGIQYTPLVPGKEENVREMLNINNDQPIVTVLSLASKVSFPDELKEVQFRRFLGEFVQLLNQAGCIQAYGGNGNPESLMYQLANGMNNLIAIISEFELLKWNLPNFAHNLGDLLKNQHLVTTNNIAGRTNALNSIADYLIVFLGGTGTLDELLAALFNKKYEGKPVIILNPLNLWGGFLFTFLEDIKQYILRPERIHIIDENNLGEFREILKNPKIGKLI